jgi:hypothetical protein
MHSTTASRRSSPHTAQRHQPRHAASPRSRIQPPAGPARTKLPAKPALGKVRPRSSTQTPRSRPSQNTPRTQRPIRCSTSRQAGRGPARDTPISRPYTSPTTIPNKATATARSHDHESRDCVHLIQVSLHARTVVQLSDCSVVAHEPRSTCAIVSATVTTRRSSLSRSSSPQVWPLILVDPRPSAPQAGVLRSRCAWSREDRYSSIFCPAGVMEPLGALFARVQSPAPTSRDDRSWRVIAVFVWPPVSAKDVRTPYL